MGWAIFTLFELGKILHAIIVVVFFPDHLCQPQKSEVKIITRLRAHGIVFDLVAGRDIRQHIFVVIIVID